jgi:Domain of unknown function (DUF4430)
MTRPSFRHIFIAFLLIITGLILLYRPAVDKSSAPQPSPTAVPSLPSRPVMLTIDFGDRKTYSATSDISASASAFSLLQAVAARQNLSLTFRDYSFGTLVESVGGLKNTSQKAWVYFINGKSPDIGADKYLLSPGDKVEWKYLKPSL